MILFINSSETDYGQDILFAGLVQKLGREKIIDYPFNINYFISRKPYPRNMGQTTKSFQQKVSYITKTAKYRIRIDWSKIKAVIVGSCKAKAFQNYLSIIHEIPNSIPRIFNDGGDFPELAEHLFKDRHLFFEAEKIRPFDFILKREKIINKDYENRVIAFPFGFNLNCIAPSTLQISEKKYDVSFWAVESHPIRTQALKMIENKFDCKANGTTVSQKFKDYKRKGQFYLEELKRCNVVLNFRGAGWDTLRYWEVPSLSTLLISEKPEIEIPHNFVHGESILFCKSDLSDLIELCEWALNNKSESQKIAEKSYKQIQSFHSADKRAEQVLNLIRY